MAEEEKDYYVQELSECIDDLNQVSCSKLISEDGLKIERSKVDKALALLYDLKDMLETGIH